VWPACLACALMLLCGHYHIVYIGLLGCGLYYCLVALCEGPAASRLPRLAWTLGVLVRVGVCAAALCMVQVLPMAESLGLSQRAGREADFASSFAPPPWNLLTYLCPQLYGNWVDVPCFGSWSYSEAMGSLGLVPLVLAAASPALLPARR